MNYTFLISSAIKTKFGVYTAEQRLEQTRATIESIRSRVPTAKIILIECSGAGIEPHQLEALSGLADHVIDFTEDPQVISLYNSTDSWDVVKNGCEIMCYIKAFMVLKEHGLLADQDRVFKISGRYTLNDDFKIDYYGSPEVQDKIVIGSRKPSQFPLEMTQQGWQYMSRLWSWPTSRMQEIEEVYNKSVKFFLQRLSSSGYIDIEHLLAKYLNPDNVIEQNSLGIEGNISPNGEPIKD